MPTHLHRSENKVFFISLQCIRELRQKTTLFPLWLLHAYWYVYQHIKIRSPKEKEHNTDNTLTKKTMQREWFKDKRAFTALPQGVALKSTSYCWLFYIILLSKHQPTCTHIYHMDDKHILSTSHRLHDYFHFFLVFFSQIFDRRRC